jgi:hypothetical protein
VFEAASAMQVFTSVVVVVIVAVECTMKTRSKTSDCLKSIDLE